MLPIYSALLQYRRSQSQASQGFTLIELLVTIIIVGVLSAIALPSYLGQVAKARGSEAKSTLGSINRSQQAYRLEKGTMADSLSTLNIPVSAKFYNYSISVIDAYNAVTITTTQEPDLRAYSSRVQQSNDTFLQIICESNETVPQGTNAIAPANLSTCSSPDYKIVR
jgi:type IV pilus assembly protein PilA